MQVNFIYNTDMGKGLHLKYLQRSFHNGEMAWMPNNLLLTQLYEAKVHLAAH